MRNSRIQIRRRGEQGAALPIALAVLILCSVVTAIVTQYTSNGLAIGTQLADQRSNLYAASGGIDSAIKWAQSDPTFTAGSPADTTNCPASASNAFFTATGLNGQSVVVNCQSEANGVGAGGATTKAPGFAILTTAPYHGPAPNGGNGGGSYPQCDNVNDEAGVLQVQSDKLVQIHGNVYDNSDADSDVWSNGCPGVRSALPMVVVGNVLQRESDHDFCAGPVPNPQPVGYDDQCKAPAILNQTKGYSFTGPIATPTAAQAALLQDPGLGPNAAEWTAPFTTPPALGSILDINGNAVTGCPTSLTPSGVPFVHFTPGTYKDASVFNTLTNGSCSGAVLWFAPGNYYFDFSNAATSPACLSTEDAGLCAHQWSINDPSVRIVGGQANAVATDPAAESATWVAGEVKSASVFSPTNPNTATVIDGATNNAVFSSGTASITLDAFATATGTAIPADATINAVHLRIVHGENTPALAAVPTFSLTAGGSTTACTGLPALTKSPTAALIQNRPDVTSCLNTPAKIDLGPTVTYSVAHAAPAGSETESLDGLVLEVDYTTPGRPAWDPTVPSTITAQSPAVPGACRHETDPGWTDGDQFVFGGDSRVFLKSGKFEVCDKPSTTHQEITMYGVRSLAAPAPVAKTWTAQTATNGATNGFTATGAGIYTNGRVTDGTTATAALSSTVTSRTMTLSQFSPTTWPIPAANAIPTDATINSVELDVTHSDGTGTNSPQVTVSSGATTCGTSTLATHTGLSATGADLVNLTSCLNTPALLSAGVSALFTARRTSGSPTEALDGMQLKVTYTPKTSWDGTGLEPQSGCLTKTPYYNGGNATSDHSPAYQGACAMFRVASDAAGGTFPRVVTFWGTVYAPSAALDVPVDVVTVPVFNRGVVARMVMLGYNVANNAIVPITTDVLLASLVNRRMVLTATVGTAKVTADVEVCDYDATPCGGTPHGVKVWSWKVVR